jgi:hypothetical protein
MFKGGMPSNARNSLDENLKDIDTLLELHTQTGGMLRAGVTVWKC